LIWACHQQVPALTQALGDPDAQVRLQAHQAFEELSLTWNRLERRAASFPAVRVADGAATPSGLLRVVAAGTQVRPEKVPLTAAELQEDETAAALAALAAGLCDPDVRARRAAVHALEALGPAAAPAAPALARALADPDRF